MYGGWAFITQTARGVSDAQATTGLGGSTFIDSFIWNLKSDQVKYHPIWTGHQGHVEMELGCHYVDQVDGDTRHLNWDKYHRVPDKINSFCLFRLQVVVVVCCCCAAYHQPYLHVLVNENMWREAEHTDREVFPVQHVVAIIAIPVFIQKKPLLLHFRIISTVIVLFC